MGSGTTPCAWPRPTCRCRRTRTCSTRRSTSRCPCATSAPTRAPVGSCRSAGTSRRCRASASPPPRSTSTSTPTGGPSGSSELRGGMRLDAFADRTLHDLLDAVAAQQPAPGGGSSAAWSGALGAGLVEMAASFTLARPKYAGVHRRMGDIRREAKTLRRALLELGERDAAAGYEPVLAALRLPDKHPSRQSRLDEARSEASEVPLAVSEASAAVAELAAEAARTGSLHLRGDAI